MNHLCGPVTFDANRYYLPRPWMQASNALAVFEEYGLPPVGVSLQWCGTGNEVTRSE